MFECFGEGWDTNQRMNDDNTLMNGGCETRDDDNLIVNAVGRISCEIDWAFKVWLLTIIDVENQEMKVYTKTKVQWDIE